MGGVDEAPVVLRRIEPEQNHLGGRSGFVVVEGLGGGPRRAPVGFILRELGRAELI
jgi:hypothetical protein